METQQSSNAKREPGRLLLIDDDRTFGLLMSQSAKAMNLHLDYYESLGELGFVGLVGDYDAAILDYDLGNMTGLEIGSYVTAFFDHMPMLLISGSNRDLGPSPAAQAFMLKTQGTKRILEAVLRLIEVSKHSTEPDAGMARHESLHHS